MRNRVPLSEDDTMNEPHICMFCRYRKRTALDLEACCAGAEAVRAQPDAAPYLPQASARGIPERLRQPAPKPYHAPR
jgi:hypothetical protein